MVVVICSARRHSAILETRLVQAGPENSYRVLLDEAVSDEPRNKAGTYVRSGIAGPVLEKSLRVEEKELVLALAVEESLHKPLVGLSANVWTLWLSFRTPLNTSISESISTTIDNDQIMLTLSEGETDTPKKQNTTYSDVFDAPDLTHCN